MSGQMSNPQCLGKVPYVSCKEMWWESAFTLVRIAATCIKVHYSGKTAVLVVQDRRLVEAGGNLLRPLCPSSLLKKSHLVQVAQGHVWAAFGTGDSTTSLCNL